MSYWSKNGFLVDIPEERKKDVEDLLSYSYFLVANRTFGKYTIMIPPIILRILKVMDLTENEISLITDIIIDTFENDFQKIVLEGVKDPEVEYCKRYAEDYIKQHNNGHSWK